MPPAARHWIAFAACWLGSVPMLVQAAQFRATLDGFLAPAATGKNFSVAAFDFGVSFRRIDSVSLAMYVPGGFGGWGIITTGEASAALNLIVGEEMQSLDLEKLLVRPGALNWQPFRPQPLTPAVPVDNCPDMQPAVIRGGFVLHNIDLLHDPDAIVLDPEAWNSSHYNGQVEQIIPLASYEPEAQGGVPEFMFDGKGEAALQAQVFHMFHAPSNRVLPPPVAVSAYLIVEGVAVPEPGATFLCTAAAAALAVTRRKRSGTR